ncbi:hypothetical protein KQI63_07765 [bacterium]|nr:hypothetical protein [bacterium]
MGRRWFSATVAGMILLGGSMVSAGEVRHLLAAEYTSAYLDSMAIDLEPGSDRPYLFSGTGTSFFYGTTKTVADEGWMGLHWGDRELIDDWILTFNGVPLDRAKAEVSVRPHVVSFRWDKGVVLTIMPMGKERDDLRFSISGGDKTDTFSLFFVFPAHLTASTQKQNKSHGYYPILLSAEEDTVGIAICSDSFFSPVNMQPLATGESGNRHLVGKAIHGGMFQGPTAQVTLVYGNSYPALVSRWQELRGAHPKARSERSEWLLSEINRSPFRCEDERINKALAWAKVSMAQLWAEDETLIYAGLPWFNEGWARDTFITLPGAALVLGKDKRAKAVLERFAKWQNVDPESSDYGRMPNRARPDEVIYNTADGTPWFVRELYEYGLYTGDIELWREMMKPGGVVERSIEGTIEYHTDDYGFLTHGEADSWMDARGPEGAWSPRGDRAIEIQALWLTQLEAAVAMAEAVGGGSGTDPRVTRWSLLADELRGRLPGAFLRPDSLGLWDHLLPDGSPNEQLRPNQLFAVTVPFEPIYGPSIENRVVKTVKDSMVYHWGVASLAQSDNEFHPYHETAEYPKDAAYHNGTVWTWLSGPYKSASRQGWAIASNEIDQILDWGLPGSLSENLDAVPRDGAEWPRTSGTITQAWSLSEFLRTWYQDYIGLNPVTGTSDKQSGPHWSFDPHIPLDWGSFETRIDLQPGVSQLLVSMDIRPDSVIFGFVLDGDRPGKTPSMLTLRPFLDAQPKDGSWTVDPVELISGDLPSRRVELRYKRSGSTNILIQGSDGRKHEITSFLSGEEDKPFLKPEVREGLKALAPPSWLLLDGRLVKMEDREAEIIVDMDDPEGDDSGYGYPTDALFADGILDLTSITMTSNGAFAHFNLRFRNLIDPGWHDAYGFQLTYATLAIRTGEKGSTTTREVGANSGYKLPRNMAADRFVDVGGGLNIRDASGETIAQYVPNDPRYPLGDVASATVSFNIPLDLIGGDSHEWKITVLVGAQDDHGGAGIGEFRNVSETGGRWEGSGGGPDEHNVYDILEVN